MRPREPRILECIPEVEPWEPWILKGILDVGPWKPRISEMYSLQLLPPDLGNPGS